VGGGGGGGGFVADPEAVNNLFFILRIILQNLWNYNRNITLFATEFIYIQILGSLTVFLE